MNNDAVYEEALRELNQEYKELMNSREYLLGKKLIRNFNMIKKLHIKKVISAFRRSKKNKIVAKNYHDVDVPQTFKYDITFCVKRAELPVIVYTCIVGNYDLPKIPLIVPENYRFVLFTNMELPQIEHWEVREIPKHVMNLKSPTLINRYIKLHPHEFFESKYTFYIDGNVRMITGIDDLLCYAQNDSGIAMFNHSARNCLYREAEVCLLLNKGNKLFLEQQIENYQQAGVPKKFGLKEATVILTDLYNQNSQKILQAWWNEFLNSGSGRDQIAFPYVLWKKGMSMDYIGTLGTNVLNDPHFQISFHQN